MKSLDTNVVLRLLLDDVPEQTQQIQIMLEHAKPKSFFVADAVFFEIAWVLGGQFFQFDRKLIGDMLLQITKIPQIVCSRSVIEQVVPLYRAKSQLSFVDIYLAIYAKHMGADPLLTYDRLLAKKVPDLTALL